MIFCDSLTIANLTLSCSARRQLHRFATLTRSIMSDAASSSRPPSPSQPARRHPLLVRPLYAFQLPPKLLDSIQLRSIDVEDPSKDSQTKHQQTSPADGTSTKSSSRPNALSCTVCPSSPTFESSGHQRAHFRSEWHRYNLQVTLKAGSGSTALVDEAGWEELVNDLGESTTDGEDGASTDTRSEDLVTLVVRKLSLGKSSDASADDSVDEEGEDALDTDGRHARHSVTAKSALLWFMTPQANADTSNKAYFEQLQLGIYRSLFPDPTDPKMQQLQLAAQGASDWHVGAAKAIQAATLRRTPAKGNAQGWRGKRLKGMEEAAGVLGMNFLEGEGYLSGVSTTLAKRDDRNTHDIDEEDSSDSDGQVESSSSESESEVSQSSIATQVSRSVDPPLRSWTIILFGGGHFSIAVVALNPHIAPRISSKARPCPEQGSDAEILQEDRSLIVLAHKAFHRYTTRKKQGGSQSAQDASGKFAKSAGAQLRRYGEAALAEEVRALLGLSGYRKLIGDSERVYVRANGRTARGILWTWPGAASASMPNASPLEGPRTDGRMRTIPFTTRNKATVGECLRAFAELVKVKITRKTDEELEEEDEAYRRSLAGNQAARDELKKRRQKERDEREDALRKSRERAQQRKLSITGLDKDEKKKRERLERLVDMVRRGRVDALSKHLTKHASLLEGDGINASLPQWWRTQELAQHRSRKGPLLVPTTLLHLASEAGQEDVVQWLLAEKHADPTLGVPPVVSEPQEAQWPHRTAYDLLPPGSKGARNVFRKMYAHQPDLWNWNGSDVGGARVDSPLTEEMEGNQSRRRANMREKARAREKEREAREAKGLSAAAAAAADQLTSATAEQPQVQASHETRNRLGGPGSQGAPRVLKEAKDKMEGVTPEMRQRIEREKRARAAEERMKRLQGGSGSA